MAKAIRKVDEALVVTGSSSRSAIERVLIAFRGIDGCVVTQPSSEIVHIAETTKKFAGRTTHVCVVTAVSEPQRLVIHLHGELQSERLDSLKAAIVGTSVEGLRDHAVASFAMPPTPSRPSAPQAPQLPTQFVPQQIAGPTPNAPLPHISPPPGMSPAPRNSPVPAISPQRSVVQEPDDWFVPRPTPTPSPAAGMTELHRLALSPPVLSPVVPGAAPGRVFQMRVADGRRFEIGELVLIGRSPTASAQEAGATLVSLDDDGVSKTHLALGRVGDEMWVEDRRSMNGTILVDEGGRQIVLIPRQRTMVRLPSTILVGDTVVALVQL